MESALVCVATRAERGLGVRGGRVMGGVEGGGGGGLIPCMAEVLIHTIDPLGGYSYHAWLKY